MLPRHFLLPLSLIASFALLAQSPAPRKLDGTWKGVTNFRAQGCTIDLVMATRHYTGQTRCNGKSGSESGDYDFTNGVVTLHASDWGPAPLPSPGGPGGPGSRFPSPTTPAPVRPLDGIYQVEFPTPRTMIWRDSVSGITISFTRLH